MIRDHSLTIITLISSPCEALVEGGERWLTITRGIVLFYRSTYLKYSSASYTKKCHYIFVRDKVSKNWHVDRCKTSNLQECVLNLLAILGNLEVH